MKPMPWAILSGCGCGFLTLIGGGAILCLAAWGLFEYADVRTIAGIKNNGGTMLPIAFSISAFLAVPLGCGVGFLVYRWRQKKEAHRPPVQNW